MHELHVRLPLSMAGLSKLGLLFCKAIVQGEQPLVGCHAAAAVPMLIGWETLCLKACCMDTSTMMSCLLVLACCQ